MPVIEAMKFYGLLYQLATQNILLKLSRRIWLRGSSILWSITTYMGVNMMSIHNHLKPLASELGDFGQKRFASRIHEGEESCDEITSPQREWR